jgi:HK97 gp10 family phage protein
MGDGFTFKDNSDLVKAALHAASVRAMEAALLFVESEAKESAKVGTGELRDKIDHRVISDGDKVTGQVGSPLKHAVYVEFGTGEFAENGKGKKGGWYISIGNGVDQIDMATVQKYKMPISGEKGGQQFAFTHGQKPQPFLRPAFRRNKKNIESIIGKEFSNTFGTNMDPE